MRKALVLMRLTALVLLAAVACAAQQAKESAMKATEERARSVFVEAQGLPENAPQFFEFSLSGAKYRIGSNGTGRMLAGKAARPFNLRLEKELSIERLYFATYGGDLLLLCGVSDGESGGGLLMRLGLPSQRVLWKQEIPGFNVGPALIEGGQIYLTAIDFVARLDLASGKYAWKHDALDARTGREFNSFEPPEMRGKEVLFRESATTDGRARIIRIEKKTGRIISID